MSAGRSSRRWAALGLAVLLLGLGLGCLNYTKAHTLEHHLAWSRENGYPEPGPGLFYSGVALVLVGAAGAGFALARR